MTQQMRIRQRIASMIELPVEKVNWHAAVADSPINSFLLVETIVDLQEEFKVRLFHEDVGRVTCLEDLVQLVAGRMEHGDSFGREPVSDSVAHSG